MNKPILFYHHSMEALAKKTAKVSGAELGKIQWKKFKDGFPDLFIENIKNIKGRDVIFLASIHHPAVLFEQLGVIHALPRYQAGSLRIVLPYYPVGTMERVDEDKMGAIATAMTMARLLSVTPQCHGSGPATLTVFDIHALGEWFYFSDNIIPDLRSAMPLLKEKIKGIKNVAIAFPDDGAKKRFGKMFSGYPLIICDKVRQGDDRIITIKEGDPRGKYVIIVDDLVMTGGTLIKCRHKLIAAGAIQVDAFVPHGVFPEESWKKFTPDLFGHVWITDSCPNTVKAIGERKPFSVLSLSNLIAEVI